MNNEAKEAEARRLAWRCRRGLLELDIVLQRFVASQFTGLTNKEIIALDALLALPDNEFWALLVHRDAPIEDLETKKLIKKIQTLHKEN